jgi:hypothetical protein
MFDDMFDEDEEEEEEEEEEEDDDEQPKPKKVPFEQEKWVLQEKIQRLEDQLKEENSGKDQDRQKIVTLEARLREQRDVLDKLLSKQDRTQSVVQSSGPVEAVKAS